MKQSKLFTRTLREVPKDEVTKNAELLLKGGFVYKEMAGVYAYLPLGLRVLNKINNIIREEMDALGGQEVFLTVLQRRELWEKSDRWSEDKVDNWFKTKLKNGAELGLGFTHEEPLTEMMKSQIKSYKDLPVFPYQIQTKFRNEARAKSGLLRCREFLMKDLYSFCRDQTEQDAFYETAKEAYHKIFTRVGLGEQTFICFSSGGVFSKYSHEFQTLCEAGEDTIYLDRPKKIAVNREVYNDEVLRELGLDKKNMEEVRAIEVGNIFPLGTRFSEALGLKYTDENGREQTVVMGCYGIGPGRVLGTIVEVYHDDKGIIWPEAVSPFQIHLISLCKSDEDKKKADELYAGLVKQGKEVLYDDREASAGEKFADSDLLGIPTRYLVSAKTLAQDSWEIKDRKTGLTKLEKIYV